MEHREASEGVVNSTYITPEYVVQEPVGGSDESLRRGTAITKYLREHGAPVPEVLYEGEEPHHVVLDRIEGVSLENREEFSDEAYLEAVENAGRALAEVHKVPVRGYGKAVEKENFQKGEYETWKEFVESYIESTDGYIQSDEFSGIAGRASELVNAGEMPEGPDSAVLHMDYTPDNIIVGEDLEATVIDFDDAYYGDPDWDLIHSSLIMSKRGDEVEEAFREGYENIRDVNLGEDLERSYTALAVLQQAKGGEWCLRNSKDVDIENWRSGLENTVKEIEHN